MTLTADDRLAIAELIALHGHLFDGGELDRLDELFTADVCYDVTDIGGGTLHGIDAIRDATLALGEGNPVGPDGWRISHRTISARRAPLGGLAN